MAKEHELKRPADRQVARDEGVLLERLVLRRRVSGGHLELLQWARAQVLPCPWAAEGGHLELLQWARAQGAPWDTVRICAYAEGQPEVLLLRNSGCMHTEPPEGRSKIN